MASIKIGNQLKVAALISYCVILFNIIAGLLYTPWMISKIGKGDYGLYILVTTFLAYFVVDYGMFQSVNKLISQYRAEGAQDKIEKTIGIATKIYLSWDVIVCIILVIVYFLIDSVFTNLSSVELQRFKRLFVIGAVFGVLNFPFGFVRGLMFAYEYMVENRLFELGAKLAVILFTIFVLLLDKGLYWLVLVYSIVPFLKNMGIVFFLYRKGIKMNLMLWDRDLAKSVVGISIWLFIFVIAELFVNNISPTIIALNRSLEQVAVFAIGFTIYGYTYQISNSVAGLFLPKVARMRRNGSFEDIREYANKIARLQLVISGFIIFGIITTGSRFIFAWVGESFSDSYYVAILMIIPGLVLYIQQVELAHLYTENKIFFQSCMMVLTAIMSISLSFFLTPLYGAVGAAIAISISNILFMVIGMNVVYQKVLNFNSGQFYSMLVKFVSVFVAISGFAIAFDIFIFEPYLESNNNWLNFVVLAIFYSFLFSLSAYFILFNEFEKQMIINIFKKSVRFLRIRNV